MAARADLPAAVTRWDFEDGTLQGWSNVFPLPSNGLHYIAREDPGSGGNWRPRGNFWAAVEPFGDRDANGRG